MGRDSAHRNVTHEYRGVDRCSSVEGTQSPYWTSFHASYPVQLLLLYSGGMCHCLVPPDICHSHSEL